MRTKKVQEVNCDEDTENPVDTDGDGINDHCEPKEVQEVNCDEDTENPVDTDGDGINDHCEPKEVPPAGNPNSPPEANAGQDQVVNEGNTVSLSASQSL